MSQAVWFYKDARIAGSAVANVAQGRIYSLWRFGGVPGAGAIPSTSVAVPTNATAGSLRQANPTGPNKLWLAGGCVDALTGSGTIIVYDRLLHVSGLSGTVTTPQTVGGALTRYTDGKYNQAFLEIYDTVGTAGQLLTAEYVNQDGDTKTSIGVLLGSTGHREQGLMIPIPLASGDTGFRTVNSVMLADSTGTDGNFGVTLARTVMSLPMVGGSGNAIARNLFLEPPFREVLSDACLALAATFSSTTTQQLYGQVTLVEA